MPIFRLIIAIAIIWIVVSFYKRIQRKLKARHQAKPIKQHTTDEIIPCAHCGVHIPSVDAIKVNEHYFCSRSHAEEYKQQ